MWQDFGLWNVGRQKDDIQYIHFLCFVFSSAHMVAQWFCEVSDIFMEKNYSVCILPLWTGLKERWGSNREGKGSISGLPNFSFRARTECVCMSLECMHDFGNACFASGLYRFPHPRLINLHPPWCEVGLGTLTWKRWVYRQNLCFSFGLCPLCGALSGVFAHSSVGAVK